MKHIIKKIFVIKICLTVFALTLSLQSWTKADDISEFEIEGMSIGNNLLDFMTTNEINQNTLPYFEDKRKYYIVGIIDNLKTYDQVEIYLKSNDKNYEIRSILAGLIIDDLNKCLEKKKQIVKDLDTMFNNVKKVSGQKKHEADITGNSIHYIDQYNINFPNHIRVECTKFSKEMINSGRGQNSLNIVVMTKEINDWVASGYK